MFGFGSFDVYKTYLTFDLNSSAKGYKAESTVLTNVYEWGCLKDHSVKFKPLKISDLLRIEINIFNAFVQIGIFKSPQISQWRR